MATPKPRLAVFSLLLVLAFATCVSAQPEGSESSYAQADWAWSLLVGNQFVEMASNQFGPTSTSNVPETLVDPQLCEPSTRTANSYHQSHRDVNAYGPPPPVHQTSGVPFNAQSNGTPFSEPPVVPTFAQQPDMAGQVQDGMAGSVVQWRPSQSLGPSTALMPPFSAAEQPTGMVQPRTPINMAYPSPDMLPTDVHPANQRFLSPTVRHELSQSPLVNPSQPQFHPPRSHPFQSDSLPDGFLLTPSAPSTPPGLAMDVSSNYNFHEGMNESSPGMMGWLRRASSVGDRVMPRVDTNLLTPPASAPRSQAPPSPSSASTTHSSGRLGNPKRSRTQMTVGHYPYTCRLCSAGFRAQGDLTHHLRCHQPYERRAHQCTECGKRFQYRKDLNRHRPKHDPNAPRYYCPHYGCKYATKGFGRQDHLDRHTSTQHRADTPQQAAFEQLLQP